MNTRPPSPTLGESIFNWWSKRNRLSKAAMILDGLFGAFFIYQVAVFEAPGTDSGSLAYRQSNYNEVTPDGSGEPEFQAGWDETMRLYRMGQLYDACTVVLQAVRNQGGVSNTWSALNVQTNGAFRTTYAFFAGTVGGCDHIAAQ